MPNSRTAVTAAQEFYSSVLRSSEHDVVTVTVDVSTLTNAEIDADGVIKPGVVLKADGTLVSGISQVAYGIVHKTGGLKVPGLNTNVAGDIAAAVDFRAALATNCVISRAEAERQLGRVYTADELSAIAAAGSHLILEQ